MMRRKLLASILALAMILPFFMTGFGVNSVSAAVPQGNEAEIMNEVPLQSLKLIKDQLQLAVGKTATLSVASFLPLDTTSTMEAKWYSSNSSVVKMTGIKPGQIRAVTNGRATITCEIDGIKGTCIVSVGQQDIEVESFELSETRVVLEEGDTLTVALANVLPAGSSASLFDAKWFISNAGVLTATEDVGVFQATKVGYTTLTCQIKSLKAYVKVFVEERTTPPPTPTPVIPDNFDDLTLVKVADIMFDEMYEDFILDKMKMFDEYNEVLANNPLSANPYMPPINSDSASNTNTWRSPGSAWDQDHTVAKIDMLREWQMYQIFIYDGPIYAPSTWTVDGSAPYEVMGGSFAVYAGDTLLFSYDLTNEGKWVGFNLAELIGPTGIKVQQLTFVKTQDTSMTGGYRYSWGDAGWQSDFGQYVCDANIVEVAMYGIPLGDDPIIDDGWELQPDGRPATDFGFSMTEFIGTNSFFTERTATYAPIGFVREYHNWSWTEYAANDRVSAGVKNATGMTSDPKVAFIDDWGFDAYYQKCKDLGVEVVLCIQGGVLGASHARPDFQGDQNPTKATSYLAHGQSLFQHAARYGSNTELDLNLVKVAGNTQKAVGMDLVRYYENWNEPNLGSFSGAQFAAMTSADYDGHMNTMGPDVGIKNADPNAKLVLGGLAGMVTSTKYFAGDWNCTQFVKDMLKWFDVNRSEEKWLEANGTMDGYVKYPFDVMNCHYYCPDGIASTGLSPEADHLYERVTEFVEFCETYLPDKEIWLSEFGWDTTQGTTQSATIEYEKNGAVVNEGINPGLTGKEVQGRWLIREMLILAAAGIDRAQQFLMGDGVTDGPNRFETCGLIDGNGNKAGWYYIHTLKAWLGNMQFQEIYLTEEDLLAYRFKEIGEDYGAIAIWNTTSTDKKTPDYELTLPEGALSAQLITLVDGMKDGAYELLDVVDGKVTIEVSEKPVFVLYYFTEEPGKDPPVYPERIILNPDYVSSIPDNLTGHGDYRGIADQQDDVGDPLSGAAKKLTDFSHYWQAYGGERIVVDLGGYYKVTDLFMFSRHGTNDLIPLRLYGGAEPPEVTAEREFIYDTWTLIGESRMDLWEDYVHCAVKYDGLVRYIVLENLQGPNPGGVYELVVYGILDHLAEDLGPDPELPDPEVDFYYAEDFSDGTFGTLQGLPLAGARTEPEVVVPVEGDSFYDETIGNVMKLPLKEMWGQRAGFLIPKNVTQLMLEQDYVLDFKFFSDGITAPNVWYIMEDLGFHEITSGNDWGIFHNGGAIPIAQIPAGQWHHFALKFKVEAENRVVIEIYMNGQLTGRTLPNNPDTIDNFSLLQDIGVMFNGKDGNPIYIGGVYLYSGTVVLKEIDWTGAGSTPTPTPDPGEPTPTPVPGEPTPTPEPTPTGNPDFDGTILFSEDFSGGTVGAVEGLPLAGTRTEPEIVTPTAGDAFFQEGIGNVMKLPLKDMWAARAGFFISRDLLNIEVGEDYILDFSVYSDKITTPCIWYMMEDLSFGKIIEGLEWGVFYEGNGGAIGVANMPAGQWNRYVLKFHVVDATTVNIEIIVNGVSSGPVLPFQSASVNDFSLTNDIGVMFQSLIGGDYTQEIYVSDISVYTGTTVR